MSRQVHQGAPMQPWCMRHMDDWAVIKPVADEAGSDGSGHRTALVRNLKTGPSTATVRLNSPRFHACSCELDETQARFIGAARCSGGGALGAR